MSVSGIASGFGASIAVRRVTEATSGQTDLNRTPYGKADSGLTDTQRKGMVDWLSESRLLHGKLVDAIKLVKGSTFGLRDIDKAGRVETSDLGLSAADAAAQMDTVSDFSSVSAGTLTIGGEAVTIDPSTMSFDDVVTAIGDTAAANATYDGDTLTIIAEDGALELDSDSSGFLSAVGLTTGTTAATTLTTGRRSNDSLVNAITEIAELTTNLFRRKDGDIGQVSPLAALRGRLKTSLLTSFSEDDTDDSGDARSNDMGFNIDLTDLTKDNVAPQAAFAFLESHKLELQDALNNRPAEVRDYLLGTDDTKGLLQGLKEAIEASHSAVETQVGLVGGLLRTTA